MKVGDKVRLTKSYAKWHLDHIDIYYPPSGHLDKTSEESIQLHLACCLGEPVEGVITGTGCEGCFKAEWKCGPFRDWYYVERKHVELSE